MKILITIVAMLLNVTVMMADVYTDGMKKLLNEGVLSGMNLKNLPTADMEGVIEMLAPYYRENMTEKEFQQMMDFQMQPEILEATKQLMKNTADPQGMMQEIMPAMMSLMQGGQPEPLKEKECDAKLKAKILRYIEITDVEKMTTTTLNTVKKVIVTQMGGNVPQDQKEMAEKSMTSVFDYMGSNVKVLIFNVLTGCNEKSMDAFLSIEKQPFFPAYKKVGKAVLDDMPKIMTTIVEKMLPKQ